MSERQRAQLARLSLTQIRDALLTLHFTDSGFHEDEAQAALDALDWLEANVVPAAVTPWPVESPDLGSNVP